MRFPPDTEAKIAQIDRFWRQYRSGLPVETVITTASEKLGAIDGDVVICGGTLGLLLGLGLQLRGLQVTIIERGLLQGREQEWNISRSELQNLVEAGLLTPEELAQVIVTEYNPGRVGFRGGTDYWVRDVLNLGVSPRLLLAILKEKLIRSGGRVQEHCSFTGAVVHPDGVAVHAGECLRARLLLDCMGYFSPISRQGRHQLYGHSRPDSICMVVGGCAQGLKPFSWGDLLYTFTPIEDNYQYFWEAFPAQDGRTTYLFTYSDLHPDRGGFEQLFRVYQRLMPQYQDSDPETIEFHRILGGFFPAYRNSPLGAAWDRVLSIGDSGGNQSPLSFGGFGAMVRHLPRLVLGLTEALEGNHLDRGDLSSLQPYQPNIGVTWLFQRVMRVEMGRSVPPDLINRVLDLVFREMAKLDPLVMRTFLQDVVQFSALTQTMAAMAIADPLLIARVVGLVGAGALGSWLGHYSLLGGYELLRKLPASRDFRGRRQWEAWSFGAGHDRLAA